MANETTSVSQTALIATEKIADGAILANLPKHVFNNLLHGDSIDGAGTNKKNYAVENDLGAAAGGTEGVDVAPTVELGMGTTVEVTPTRGVDDMALITLETAQRRLGGMPYRSVLELFQSEDEARLTAVLGPDIRRLVARAMQKVEADALALLSGISNTVGSSGSDVTVTNLLTSIYTLKTQQPHRPPSEWGFVLWPNQVLEIDLEAAVTGGGLGGALWNTQADFGLLNRPEGDPANGFVGTFLRYGVWEPDHELRITANAGADVVGALMCLSDPGTPPDAPQNGGKVAFGVMLEGYPLTFSFEYDASMGGIEAVDRASYAHAELADPNAVGIVTDAP